MKRILIVVTNTGSYASGRLKTGLWLSELTHIFHCAQENGWHTCIASPRGGAVPLDPESLKLPGFDKISKKYYSDPAFMDLLAHTPRLAQVEDEPFDCIYLAGGHGTMYDFPEDATLQTLIRRLYERDKIVAAICHGVGGLLNVQLSDGRHLITGKSMTGFDWFEESLARRKREVPFNLEAAIKERGAHLKKACIPMTANVVVDGRLITGQNPFSSREMAKVLARELGAG